MNDSELANSSFPSGENEFEFWLYGENKPGGWDKWTLATLVHLFKSYWQQKDASNIHLFHYSNMKRDLPSAISAMAKALGYEYDAEKINEFAAAASFDHMKKNASQFAPQANLGFWKSDSNFFNRGKDSDWSEMFSDEQQQAFDNRIQELLSEEERNWLIYGKDA